MKSSGIEICNCGIQELNVLYYVLVVSRMLCVFV